MARIYPLDGERDIMTAYFEVEYEDVFHLKELYKRCYEWFLMWNYESLEGDDIPETLYFERVNHAGTQEHHVWWRWQKEINHFVKYFIKFDIQTLNTSKVEIMHKGKKAKTNKSDIIFRVRAYVMTDWKEEFKNHSLLKQFDNWFRKRWYRQEREAHKKQLWFETYNLEDSIKQYLTIHTAFDIPEPFQPNKGLP